MSLLARVLLSLLAALGLLAWGATVLLNVTARSWFEREVSMRARLAVGGARNTLLERLSAREHRRLTATLDDIARDERITAVEVCGPGAEPVAHSHAFPAPFRCDAVRARLDAVQTAAPGSTGSDFAAALDGEPVHVSVVPLWDEERLAATVVPDQGAVDELLPVERGPDLAPDQQRHDGSACVGPASTTTCSAARSSSWT